MQKFYIIINISIIKEENKLKQENKPKFVNIDKAKTICFLYKSGNSVTTISKAFELDYCNVVQYLKRYFEYFYNEPYVSSKDVMYEKYKKLYEKYKDVYTPGGYTKQQLCKILNCKTIELDSMRRYFGLKNQWHQVYNRQRTLCNVSNEF